MSLFAVFMGYGLYIVRAEDEADARRVAYAGPNLGDGEPHGTYSEEFDEEALVVALDADGPSGLLASYFA